MNHSSTNAVRKHGQSVPPLPPTRWAPKSALAWLIVFAQILALTASGLAGAGLALGGAWTTTSVAHAQSSVTPMVSAGTGFSCALASAGTVKCWGDQWNGTLGDGQSYNSGLTISNRSTLTPQNVLAGATPLSGAVKIVSGQYISCALMSNSGVKCWGAGYLGTGATAGPSTAKDVITAVGNTTPLTGVVDIASGLFMTCAIMTDATLKCWGGHPDPANAGFGMFPYFISAAPVTISGLSGVTSVSAGYSAICVSLNTGQAKCWGHNGQGQLGNNTTTNSSTPQTVLASAGTPLTGVVAVKTFTFTSCALMTDGSVKCWGYNAQGELARGLDTTPTPSNRAMLPLTVPSLSGVTKFADGSGANDHVCVVLATGMTKCWGDNFYSQYGIGLASGWTDGAGTTSVEAAPNQAFTSGPVLNVATGGNHTCAMLTTGAVQCWGDNTYEQLGRTTNGRTHTLPDAVGDGAGGSLNGFGTTPVLSLVKTAPASLTAGTPATYNFAISNANGSATTATIADRLPPLVQYTSAAAGTGATPTCTSDNATATGELVTCTIALSPALGTTGSATWTMVVTPQAGAANTLVVNKASIDSSGGAAPVDPATCTALNTPTLGCAAPTNPTAVFGALAGTTDLAVTKSASVAQASAGTAFDYTITVTNNGATAATNVKATDKLPAGVTYNSATILTGSGSCSQAAGVVTCTWGSVAAGASVSAKINVTP